MRLLKEEFMMIDVCHKCPSSIFLMFILEYEVASKEVAVKIKAIIWKFCSMFTSF